MPGAGDAAFNALVGRTFAGIDGQVVAALKRHPQGSTGEMFGCSYRLTSGSLALALLNYSSPASLRFATTTRI